MCGPKKNPPASFEKWRVHGQGSAPPRQVEGYATGCSSTMNGSVLPTGVFMEPLSDTVPKSLARKSNAESAATMASHTVTWHIEPSAWFLPSKKIFARTSVCVAPEITEPEAAPYVPEAWSVAASAMALAVRILTQPMSRLST